ncbi:MAG TPA: hypothetical protein VFV38_10270 [Ktedonobacteraceae bacterium]|nr:hypothetical protein [Ktedonobacteraceae bacterium]
MKVLDLTDFSTWPPEIISHLDKYHSLYLDWESGIHQSSGFEYDSAIEELKELVRFSGYAMRGYHCTRLTEAEMQAILANGMSLPNLTMLRKRIADVAAAEMLEGSIVQRLMSDNQANDANRVGIIWFCFFPPRNAGQWGIESFFRSWGGEALYNSHNDDPATGPVLAKIGIPCIIEALVPLISLPSRSWLDSKLILRFLISRGFETEEDLDHEDYSKSPIPAENIVRIIRFPDADFVSLTGCSKWKPLLQLSLQEKGTEQRAKG